jgi:hypothetical protein
MAEHALEEGPKTMRDVPITGMAKHTSGGSNFMGFGVMLKSHAKELAAHGCITNDGNIDWEALRKSPLATATASNNEERGIINVTNEQFQKAQLGFTADIIVNLNEDDDGNQYLNCKVLDVHLPSEIEGDEVTVDDIQRTEVKQ